MNRNRQILSILLYLPLVLLFHRHLSVHFPSGIAPYINLFFQYLLIFVLLDFSRLTAEKRSTPFLFRSMNWMIVATVTLLRFIIIYLFYVLLAFVHPYYLRLSLDIAFATLANLAGVCLIYLWTTKPRPTARQAIATIFQHRRGRAALLLVALFVVLRINWNYEMLYQTQGLGNGIQSFLGLLSVYLADLFRFLGMAHICSFAGLICLIGTGPAAEKKEAHGL